MSLSCIYWAATSLLSGSMSADGSIELTDVAPTDSSNHAPQPYNLNPSKDRGILQGLFSGILGVSEEMLKLKWFVP